MDRSQSHESQHAVKEQQIHVLYFRLNYSACGPFQNCFSGTHTVLGAGMCPVGREDSLSDLSAQKL